MKKKIPEWIHLKYDVFPAQFVCLRCGAKRDSSLPAAIDDFIKQGQAFYESHKHCKEEKSDVI